MTELAEDFTEIPTPTKETKTMTTQTITHRQRIDELKSEIAQLERKCASLRGVSWMTQGDFEEADELDWRIMNLRDELEEVETEWRELGDIPAAESDELKSDIVRTGSDPIKGGWIDGNAYVKWIQTDEAEGTWIFCSYVVNGEERLYFDGWKTDVADFSKWKVVNGEETKVAV